MASKEIVSNNTKINIGDKLSLVKRVLGEPIRSRIVQDPFDKNLSIVLLDYETQTGFFSSEVKSSNKNVITKFITFVIKNGAVEKIVPNPNNPTDQQRSTLKGIPGFVTAVVVSN